MDTDEHGRKEFCAIAHDAMAHPLIKAGWLPDLIIINVHHALAWWRNDAEPVVLARQKSVYIRVNQWLGF